MADVIIRRAVVGDLGGAVELLRGADELHRHALPWLFRQADAAALAGFLEPYVLERDRAMFLAGAPDGSLAGVLYMGTRRSARAPVVESAVVAEIDALAVDSVFRRQRIGTRLVAAALDWARASGATRTELGVYEFNEAARAFWASVGFETLSRRLVLRASVKT